MMRKVCLLCTKNTDLISRDGIVDKDLKTSTPKRIKFK